MIFDVGDAVEFIGSRIQHEGPMAGVVRSVYYPTRTRTKPGVPLYVVEWSDPQRQGMPYAAHDHELRKLPAPGASMEEVEEWLSS